MYWMVVAHCHLLHVAPPSDSPHLLALLNSPKGVFLLVPPAERPLGN